MLSDLKPGFLFLGLEGFENVLYVVYGNHAFDLITWGVVRWGGGGGGVSESMDGQGCAILALEFVPINLIFVKNPTQKSILQDFMLAISAKKTMPH